MDSIVYLSLGVVLAFAAVVAFALQCRIARTRQVSRQNPTAKPAPRRQVATAVVVESSDETSETAPDSPERPDEETAAEAPATAERFAAPDAAPAGVSAEEPAAPALDSPDPEPAVEERRDPLTGLLRREAFLQETAQRLEASAGARSKQFVVLLRIERFGELLADRGFRTAEAVLAQAAQRLQAGMRGCDLLARFDRDCFALHLVDLTPDEAEAALARLRNCVAGDYEIAADRPLHVAVHSAAASVAVPAETSRVVARLRRAI